jgi:hypothetical protein
MDPEEHKTLHRALHSSLDELVADMVKHTQASLKRTSVLELIQWSAKQTEEPNDDD